MMTSSFTVVLSRAQHHFAGILSVQLPMPIELVGDWEVCVTTLSCQPPEEVRHAWIFGDLMENTPVVDTSLQFLDIVNISKIKNSKPRYARIMKQRFSSINIEVKYNYDQDSYLTSDKDVVRILHFQKA